MIFSRIAPTTGSLSVRASIRRCAFSLVFANDQPPTMAAIGMPRMRYHQRTKKAESAMRISVSRGSFGTSCLKVTASCGTRTVMSTMITPKITTSTIDG